MRCNFCQQEHHHSVCDTSPCFRCCQPGHISQVIIYLRYRIVLRKEYNAKSVIREAINRKVVGFSCFWIIIARRRKILEGCIGLRIWKDWGAWIIVRIRKDILIVWIIRLLIVSSPMKRKGNPIITRKVISLIEDEINW